MEKSKEEIEKEEKIRVEARIKAEKEIKEKEAKEKSKKVGKGCLITILIFFALVAMIIIFSNDGDKTKTSSTNVELNVSVKFSGTQFIITNKDTFDWTNCGLGVNSSSYSLSGNNFTAGETYTVGAMQFTKDDGTRLNPFQVKPLDITFSCTTPTGSGYYYGGWK